jgi:predicted KAP-like P-loop ATPase
MECIWPSLNTIRDAKRYLSSLPVMIRMVGEDIALVDLLALEWLRQFLPNVHSILPRSAHALTSTEDRESNSQREVRQAAIDELLAAGEEAKDQVKALCIRLFPAAGAYLGESRYGVEWLAIWKRGRRVAHPDVLAYYIDLVPTEGLLASRRADRAFSLMSDEEGLNEYFESVDAAQLEATIDALLDYEDQYSSAVVEP